MLAATPPRRISRSSTRKETESLCSCSTTSESSNFPPKLIRWSVAIEPAISSEPSVAAAESGTSGKTKGNRYRRVVGDVVGGVDPSVEAVAAGAGAGGVGVVDGEPLL